MRMYDVSFLKKARELCDQCGVLLVFDEVATGFGRTGNRFVADLVLPDILVLGKALTGGYIGHAATVANRKVFEGFYDDVPEHALMHGPTFMEMRWRAARPWHRSNCSRPRTTWKRSKGSKL